MPVEPFRTASGIPVTDVLTQGTPVAMASSRTVGMPSALPSAPTTQGATKTSAESSRSWIWSWVWAPSSRTWPADPELVDAGLQLLGQDAGPGDPQLQFDALVHQFGGGGQQVLEPLLFHEAPDRGDPQCGADRAGIPVREPVQLQSVAHQVQPGGGGREAAAQVAQVEAADGHGVVGLFELQPQVVGVDRVVEDVHGMGREGIREYR